MFGGKTTELFHQLDRYNTALEIARSTHKTTDKAVLFKWTDDTRSTGARTHSGTEKDAIPVSSVTDIIGHPEYDSYKVIAIDEIQFFNDTYRCVDMVTNDGKVVIVAGLLTRFDCSPFENTMTLIPHADDIIHTKAICHVCTEPAIYTIRITDETDPILPGGVNMYRSVCRSHYCR